jgi:gluconate 2-dehydrogenase gamma chain
MAEDEKRDADEKRVAENHERALSRQDMAREKIRQAVYAQQDALAAQQRAVQSTSDAFIAEEEVAKEKGTSTDEASAKAGKETDESRRNFIKIGAGAVAGAAFASVIQVPMYDGLVVTRNNDIHTLQGQLEQADQQVTQLQGEVSTLQTQVTSNTVFLTLSVSEQPLVEAIVEAIIPSDSSGPGAKEAGVAYFIDRQLKDEYGVDGSVYVDGPWIPANSAQPVTVDGTTYPGATVTFTVAGESYNVVYPPTPDVRVGAGTRYQYAINKRDFWRVGLAGIEAYANAAYGGNFESLSAGDQTSCLTDLWNNKATAEQFNGILPSDFAYELFFLTWSGFLMDPIYGGNQNMVGWTYTGFNGVNMGNAFGEGYTTSQLMVMSTPILLKPISLGMFQQAVSGSSSSSAPSGTSTTSTSTTSSSTSSSSGGA